MRLRLRRVRAERRSVLEAPQGARLLGRRRDGARQDEEQHVCVIFCAVGECHTARPAVI
jgi:hypothetical protein